METKTNSGVVKTTAAIVVGAVLMFVLMRFLAIPTGIPYTNVNLGMAVLAVFAAIFGPVAGFLIGFIGHTLVDLSWGGVWWSWVISSGLFGLAVGSFRKYYKSEEGKFGVKQALFFNAVQTAANITAYVFIARILDLIMYQEPFGKITIQGFTAAALNTAVVLILGTILIIAYSQSRNQAGDARPKPEKETKISRDPKNILKAIGARLILGMFFVSSITTLLISEMVNFQMVNYETTVVETTENHLRSAVQALAVFISAEELDRYHTVEDMLDPEYETLRQRLIQFAEDYNVLYAYYWRDYGGGKFQFIVDNDLDPDTQVGPGDIEDIIDDVEFAALEGNVGVTDLGSYTPEWEGLLSAFAPVYDSNGEVCAVAGVDISDEFIFTQRKDASNMKTLQLIAVPLAVVFGILNLMLYAKKTRQIAEAHVKLQYFSNNLRRAFSTYLSEDVVEEIVSDPTRLRLGGEKRYMTALFTDVRNFTRIAESLSPEQLVELLNYYLSTMSDVILEKEGTIDKYEGDAIVAFFGAPLDLPDHALRACETAIMMRRLEDGLNRYVAENRLSPVPLHTRFGINSGDMVVGNMGTQKKMNYTIISNAVNLAARLEGINKQYGTWILASEDTVKGTHGKLLTRRLDRIRVVGINEPVRIHEILETNADASAALHEKVQMFNKARELFEARNWKDGGKMFSQILKAHPKDAPSRLYLHRCRKFMQYPPLDTWDGVFNFEVK